MKFCFVCGKKTEKLIEGYCEDCYNEKFNLVKIPKEVRVIVCSKCKKIKSGIRWENIRVEDFLKRNIKPLGKDVKIEVRGNRIFVTGTLEKSKKSKEESHEINLKLVKTLCLMCSQKLGGYYETVIQLRGNATNEILNFTDKKINETSFYRSEAVKGGFDFYVGNKSVANDVAELLKKKYKFKISKSYKLFTKKDGQDIYRSKILIICD
jgi:nonsense-mediated mRNA decay protein 3